MGRTIARRGAGLLVVYLSDEDRRETSAHGVAVMGSVETVTKAVHAAETSPSFAEMWLALREMALVVWRLDEPAGTPKPAGQIEPWMVS